MPQAIPYVTAFVYGAAATASAGVLAAAALGAVAQTILINMVLGQISKALGPKGSSGTAPAINVTVRNSTESRKVILGTVRAGGAIVYYNTSGTNNKYLHYVVAYAGHQCNAVKDVWLDNVKVLHANINAGTGAVTQTPFIGKLSIWRYTGTSTQAADATLDAAFASWTSAMQLKGIAYAHIRMERDDVAFPQGAPVNATALIEGAKVYDPRLDTTNGGSGSQRYTDATTWTFPTNPNPALYVRWVLTGGTVCTDTATPQLKYGLKDSNSRVADAYTITAANECDEVLTGANTTPLGDQYRYACNVELSCGQSIREWITTILDTMAGTCVYVNGKWRIYAGAYDAPTHTLTDLDIYGDLEIRDTSGHDERYNAVAATYRSAVNDYTEQTTQFRTDSAYETQDAGERIPKELGLDGVTNDPAAQRLCEIEKRKSRLMRTVKIVGALNLMKIAPWETFTLSNTKYGFTNRVFRCLEKQFDFSAEAGRVEITARVESSAVYTDMVTADYTTPDTHTPIVNVELPDPVTSLATLAVPTGIRFTVGLPAYLDANSVVQIWEYTSSTPFASATMVAEFRGNVFTLEKRDTTTRYYWIVVKNKASLQSSVEYPTSAAGTAGTADTTVGDRVYLEPADGNQAYSSGTAPVIEVTGLDGHITYTSPASIATQITVNWTANARISNTTSGAAVGEAYVAIRVLVNGSDVWVSEFGLEAFTTGAAEWAAFSGSKVFQVPAGQAIDVYLRTYRTFTTGGGFPAQTMYWKDATLDLLPFKG